MTDLRLVIFDVDGTLIDSQGHIVAAMEAAFASQRLTRPDRERILSIVGLSLPVAMGELLPGRPELIAPLVDAYKSAFVALRSDAAGHAVSPLFPGALDCLHALAAEDRTLLGIATGKSRRGLAHVLDLHGIAPLFQTVQCADDHPSKPHPSMLMACLCDTGVEADRAVIVGDTTFDVDMGRAAGIAAIGVRWGYHPAADLQRAGAWRVIDGFDGLHDALNERWEDA